MIARSSGLMKRSYQITTSICTLAFAASLTACGGGGLQVQLEQTVLQLQQKTHRHRWKSHRLPDKFL
jgi:hypothetical protein